MKPEKLHKLEPLPGIPPSFELREFKYDGNLLVRLQDPNYNSSPTLTIYSGAPFSVRITTKFAKLIDSYDLDEALIDLKKEPEYAFK